MAAMLLLMASAGTWAQDRINEGITLKDSTDTTYSAPVCKLWVERIGALRILWLSDSETRGTGDHARGIDAVGSRLFRGAAGECVGGTSLVDARRGHDAGRAERLTGRTHMRQLIAWREAERKNRNIGGRG